MKNKNRSDRQNPGGMEKTVKFLVGKGFYIVLFLCLAAIGISGYVILFSGETAVDPGLSEIPEIGLATTLDFSPLVTTAEPKVTERPSSSEKEVAVQTQIPHRPVEESTVTTPPETQGTSSLQTEKEPTLFYRAPVSGSAEQLFSGDTPVFNPTMGDWRVHAGVDYFAPVGTEIMSVSAGVVSRVYTDEFKGLCLEVNHYDGLTAVYCGMEEAALSPGDTVKAGDVVGTVGTGAVFEGTGPHLHFELRDKGTAIDPMEYIPVE